LAPAATTLYGVAALGAWLAVWAGEQAVDSLVAVPAAVQPRIGEHSDWAHYTLYLLVVIALLRIFVHLRPQLTNHRGARAAVALLGLAAFAVLGKAADLGGALVFEHGLAVQRSLVESEAEASPRVTTDGSGPKAEGASPERTPGTSEGFVQSDDGALVWRPKSGDRDALGAVLTAAPGSSLDAVRWVEDGGGEGLTLDVSGPVILLFPGTFSDVQVDATIEILGFKGTVGLVHHMAPNGDGGFFTISSEGSASLSDVRGGERSVLNQKATMLPTGTLTLAVSAAGRHLKGLLDGKTVAHGHIAAGPPGACGLQLDGRGTVRILQVRITPIKGH
jgi:uncharacterized membrane protein